ncbi:MAG: squalene synthase HpnC [Pigmentiphaga sp.]|nr:squalene synthase HpnC [Pigmentiphaga sp.]
MAPDHYENFPVASRLLPARLRPAVVALYRYARSADDLADEGDAPPRTRLAALDAYEAALDLLDAADASPPAPAAWPAGAPAAIFGPLYAAVRAHRLPVAPLRRLLSAFRQDVTQTRYPDAASLLDYCTRSADPVGELMLHLYGAVTPEHLRWSDAICTGLQLANFCQDVAIDLDKGRLYLPLDEMAAAGIDPEQLLRTRTPGLARWRQLMALQVARARAHLQTGAPLARRIPGRAGWELRLVVLGGLRILEKIEAVDYDVFERRPVLDWRDWVVIVGRTARAGR